MQLTELLTALQDLAKHLPPDTEVWLHTNGQPYELSEILAWPQDGEEGKEEIWLSAAEKPV